MEDRNCLNLSLTERILLLEETCKLHSGRMDTFQQEIKLILTEVNIIISWIHKHFDTDLLNRTIRSSVEQKRYPKEPSLIAEENRDGEIVTIKNNAEDKSSGEECKISNFQDAGKHIDKRIWNKIPDTTTSKQCRYTTEIVNIESPPGNKTAESKTDAKEKIHVQCEECGKVLKGPGSLRAHMRTHSNFRPHQCTQCGKAFRMKHHLEFHLLVHSGDKKESCSFCGKSFLVKRDLLRHERTHTGEKPFKCQYCPKSFNVKQHLTLHIRTHTGERPYKCIICGKSFSQANSLRIHKKIHLKESMDESINQNSTTNSTKTFACTQNKNSRANL